MDISDLVYLLDDHTTTLQNFVTNDSKHIVRAVPMPWLRRRTGGNAIYAMGVQFRVDHMKKQNIGISVEMA
jgi:hypothetical protein